MRFRESFGRLKYVIMDPRIALTKPTRSIVISILFSSITKSPEVVSVVFSIITKSHKVVFILFSIIPTNIYPIITKSHTVIFILVSTIPLHISSHERP